MCTVCLSVCVCVSMSLIVHACKKKTMGDCVSFVYVCVVGTMFAGLLGQVQLWMPLPETL